MKESNSPKYLKYISYLQVIGIVLVVAGHSVHLYPDGIHGSGTLFYKAVYSFHMPLFAFISGFLMIYTSRLTSESRRRPWPFVAGKLRRLILPFVTLTAVTFVPRAMMSGMADNVIEINARSFLLSFVQPNYLPIPFFWYLQASFVMLTVAYCILYFGHRIGIKVKVLVTTMFVVMFVFAVRPVSVTSVFSLGMAVELGFYFMLGAMYSVFADDVDRYIPWTRTWFAVAAVLLWGVTLVLFERTKGMILCAVAGIMMCTSLARILEARQWRFLDHLTGANYLIFLLSWYCNIASQQVLSHYVTLPWWVHTALSVTSGIYIPWLAYGYLQRHSNSRWIRLTSYLLGQTHPRK